MHWNLLFKRTTAGVLSFLLLSVQPGIVPLYSAAPEINPLRLPEDLRAIKLPANIGKIEELFTGTQKGLVILTQDAHSIPQAQRNIRNIIDYFQTAHGLNSVALEGAASKLNMQIFQSFPERTLLKRVLEDYLEAGELTGTTLAAAVNKHDAVYEGIEDWDLYKLGYGRYLNAVEQAPAIEERLKALQSRLEERMKESYSPELLEIQDTLKKFRSDETDLNQTLNTLAKFKMPPAGSELALILEESGQKDEDVAVREIELRKAAAEIKKKLQEDPGPDSAGRQDAQRKFNEKNQLFVTSRITHQEFALSLKELCEQARLTVKLPAHLLDAASRHKRVRDIEGSRFFREFEQYTRSVKESLFHSEADRGLDREERDLYLLGKLSSLELTRNEWGELAPRMQSGEAFKMEPGLGDAFAAHTGFYENAEKRDGVFFVRLKKMLERSPEDSRAVLFVAGGFHTQNLTAYLREAGISYLLVMPEIGALPAEIHYKDQMKGLVSWKDYFIAENGQVNVYKAFVRAARDKLLTESGGEDDNAGLMRTALLKEWRDQIIRDLADGGKLLETQKYTAFIDEAGEGTSYRADTGINEKVDGFIQGIKDLKEQGRLNEESVLRLLRPSNMQPLILTPAEGQEFSPEDFPALAALMNASPSAAPFVSGSGRSELRDPSVRAQFSDVQDKLPFLAAPRQFTPESPIDLTSLEQPEFFVSFISILSQLGTMTHIKPFADGLLYPEEVLGAGIERERIVAESLDRLMRRDAGFKQIAAQMQGFGFNAPNFLGLEERENLTALISYLAFGEVLPWETVRDRLDRNLSLMKLFEEQLEKLGKPGDAGESAEQDLARSRIEQYREEYRKAKQAVAILKEAGTAFSVINEMFLSGQARFTFEELTAKIMEELEAIRKSWEAPQTIEKSFDEDVPFETRESYEGSLVDILIEGDQNGVSLLAERALNLALGFRPFAGDTARSELRAFYEQQLQMQMIFNGSLQALTEDLSQRLQGLRQFAAAATVTTTQTDVAAMISGLTEALNEADLYSRSSASSVRNSYNLAPDAIVGEDEISGVRAAIALIDREIQQNWLKVQKQKDRFLSLTGDIYIALNKQRISAESKVAALEALLAELDLFFEEIKSFAAAGGQSDMNALKVFLERGQGLLARIPETADAAEESIPFLLVSDHLRARDLVARARQLQKAAVPTWANTEQFYKMFKIDYKIQNYAKFIYDPDMFESMFAANYELDYASVQSTLLTIRGNLRDMEEKGAEDYETIEGMREIITFIEAYLDLARRQRPTVEMKRERQGLLRTLRAESEDVVFELFGSQLLADTVDVPEEAEEEDLVILTRREIVVEMADGTRDERSLGDILDRYNYLTLRLERERLNGLLEYYDEESGERDNAEQTIAQLDFRLDDSRYDQYRSEIRDVDGLATGLDRIKKIHDGYEENGLGQVYSEDGKLLGTGELSKAAVYPKYLQEMTRLLDERIRGLLGEGSHSIYSIGLGNGVIEEQLALKGYQVSGIEASEVQAARARARNLQVAAGDAHQELATMAPASQDVVFIAEAIGYLRLTEITALVNRVLKPGGLIIITTYPPESGAEHTKSGTGYVNLPISRIEEEIDAGGFVRPAPSIELRQALFNDPELRRYFKRDVIQTVVIGRKNAEVESRSELRGAKGSETGTAARFAAAAFLAEMTGMAVEEILLRDAARTIAQMETQTVRNEFRRISSNKALEGIVQNATRQVLDNFRRGFYGRIQNALDTYRTNFPETYSDSVPVAVILEDGSPEFTNDTIAGNLSDAPFAVSELLVAGRETDLTVFDGKFKDFRPVNETFFRRSNVLYTTLAVAALKQGLSPESFDQAYSFITAEGLSAIEDPQIRAHIQTDLIPGAAGLLGKIMHANRGVTRAEAEAALIRALGEISQEKIVSGQGNVFGLNVATLNLELQRQILQAVASSA